MFWYPGSVYACWVNDLGAVSYYLDLQSCPWKQNVACAMESLLLGSALLQGEVWGLF